MNLNKVQTTKHGIPIQNLWYMLLYVWDVVHLKSNWNSDIEKAPTLDALLATILVNMTQQRLRAGLGRDYRTHSAEIPGVRGRIDFAESLKRMSFQRGRACCQFQTFSPNVLKNQIIRSSLTRLIQVGEFGTDKTASRALVGRLRRVVLNMETVDIIELKPDCIGRERLKRHDVDYRVMLAICHLLIQRYLPKEVGGMENLPAVDRATYILHDVYEKFVAKFYAHHLKEWSVYPQKKMAWPAAPALDYLPTMRPDLVLQHKLTGHIVVLDTKFTAKLLATGQWGKETFNRNHLFQIYAYLKSQELRSPHHANSTGILLYPAVKARLSMATVIQGHAIRWETVDLASPWEEIEKELLAIPLRAASASPTH